MAETVRVVEYYYATVSDVPGEARRLLEHLSEKGVNLFAFAAYPVGRDSSELDFFSDDADLLQEACEDAGIKLSGPKRAFLIQGDDRVGALHGHHLKLANVNINVHAAYGCAAGPGQFGYVLWVRPEDFAKAAEVLIGGDTAGNYGALHPGGKDW